MCFGLDILSCSEKLGLLLLRSSVIMYREVWAWHYSLEAMVALESGRVASQDHILDGAGLGAPPPPAATLLLRAVASWLIMKRGRTFKDSFKSYLCVFISCKSSESGRSLSTSSREPSLLAPADWTTNRRDTIAADRLGNLHARRHVLERQERTGGQASGILQSSARIRPVALATNRTGTHC